MSKIKQHKISNKFSKDDFTEGAVDYMSHFFSVFPMPAGRAGEGSTHTVWWCACVQQR